MGETLKKRPQELTKVELEIMQVIWLKEKVLVHDILAELPEPKPAYNTISTIVRILENKGFVSHKAYGRTYEYFPIVGKEGQFQDLPCLSDSHDGAFSNYSCYGGSIISIWKSVWTQ